ncbi:putative glycosyl transferase [Fimicolochytrium jonesii]|uniref:putative glycosyl transferase n=1 Tax=Fimicolochytrium jonesii TaxID=1396493 RepID=UPI0022FE4954|nr:putative glycosyl transferase [Fimicolochytrium jonesii]KAI8823442.1 putative glycosyl transferase [Fimicolochytrium jonesii]
MRGLFVTVVLGVFFLLLPMTTRQEARRRKGELPPLIKERLPFVEGKGGSWRLPPSWLADLATMPLPSNITLNPSNIREAVSLAVFLSSGKPERHIPHTDIPLIVHQTWKTTKPETWPSNMLECVEAWLWAAEPPATNAHEWPNLRVKDSPWDWSDGVDTAFFLWDDDGMEETVTSLWPEGLEMYKTLPANVMRADTFRVLVVRLFGGVYADTDTKPLRRPSRWVSETDITPWTDDVGQAHAGLGDNRIRLLVGIEADTPPDSDAYWRMGYGHPVELLQWALAGAAGHPSLIEMVESIRLAAGEMAKEGTLAKADALQLTGPFRWTDVVQGYLAQEPGFEWNSLTGLKDGGRSKVVRDVLVLPVTGFSPGRSSVFGNMGSKPVSDPDARLLHQAQGTWKHTSAKVEVGKLCRTLLGLCRDWPTVA